MKYIITETQLVKAAFRVLDAQRFKQVEIDNKIYFIHSDDNEFSDITYDKKYRICYIHMGLVNAITSFFSLKDYHESRKIILKWVERTLQMNVDDAWPLQKGGVTSLRLPEQPITESQHKLISELERTWRDSEYTEQYNRLKPKMIRYFENLVDSHSENDVRLNLFDSDQNAVMVYNKPSGDLYYNRNFDDVYGTAFPHPIWLVHGKFIMSDVFNEFFPDYEVKSVRSITLS